MSLYLRGETKPSFQSVANEIGCTKLHKRIHQDYMFTLIRWLSKICALWNAAKNINISYEWSALAC